MARRTCSESDHMSAETRAFRSPTQCQYPDDSLQESMTQMRQRALSAARRKEYVYAIAVLNQLLATYPSNAADYSNRGLLHLWNNEPRKALLDFNRAIALDPSLASSYNNRANYYAAQGAKESAIEDYDRAIDLNPFHVRARINRAVTLRELRRYDAALDGFEEALAFRQFAGEIYAERGRTYHLRGDWNGAIADYRRALKVLPAPADTQAPTVHPRWQQIVAWLNQLQPAS
ncbi:MAG: tetratricopeptide repeat protein [Leptolyngbya sp. SIO1E4]|nr:tetratricopeptide repeat protein [Leptolyngbya sp. SIO1E4]